MLNFDQVAGLIRAGFSKDQIVLINHSIDMGTDPAGNLPLDPTPTPTPAPAPAAPTPTAPDTSVQAPAEPATPAPAAAAPSAESETLTLLKEMLGLMRSGNINRLENAAPEPADGSAILAEILNPRPPAQK